MRLTYPASEKKARGSLSPSFSIIPLRPRAQAKRRHNPQPDLQDYPPTTRGALRCTAMELKSPSEILPTNAATPTPREASSARKSGSCSGPVSYTHLRAHETKANLVC